jgi:hypothetical protein
MWLYGLALSQLTSTLKGPTNKLGEENKLKDFKNIDSYIKEMIDGPTLETVI